MSNYQDFLLPFEIKGSAIRGRIVRLNHIWQDIKNRHNYPDSVNSLLSQTAVLTTLFSSLVQYDGIFTLQILSEHGIVGTLVTDITSAGDIRAVARFDQSRFANSSPKNPSESTKESHKESHKESTSESNGKPIAENLENTDLIKTLMPNGQMVFTIDQGKHTDRYQTITALGESTLEDSATNYFKQSDQVETFIKIFTNGNECGGLILQRMPDSWRDDITEDQADEKFATITTLASTLKDDEILSSKLSAEDILYRLFNEFKILTFDSQKLQDKCRCSKEKVINSMSGFPQAEILDLIDQTSKQIEVKCEFCSREYKIDPKEIIKIN